MQTHPPAPSLKIKVPSGYNPENMAKALQSLVSNLSEEDLCRLGTLVENPKLRNKALPLLRTYV